MKQRRQSFWLPGSLALFCLATTSPLQAQIVPDTTLPNTSIVTPDGNTSVITGGTQAGPNLFHSFEQFSIPTGGVAHFNNALNIQNIISRVTGSSISNINGKLQANGSANLFLINPNGIIFGSNATLAIGGSFLASTASSLKFADGTSLSATAPQNTPLLTVSVPSGLQFGKTPGSIRNQSQASPGGAINVFELPVGLQVRAGKTLALVGSDVALEGGNLTAKGGRIELGSVAGNGLVTLNPTDKGWSLGYQGIQIFQDIRLSKGAFVDASGAGGGDIQVRGRRVALTDGSIIEASTLGAEPGGTLNVTASEAVELIGKTADGEWFNGLFAQVYPKATGAGGNVTVETEQLILRNRSEVSASTYGEGTGGNITVETGQLILRERSKVTTNTNGKGAGGTLEVSASESVELVGDALLQLDGEVHVSGLFTQTGEEAIGAGGKLSISTEKLIVRDGAQVNSTTDGVGRAGDLTVRAKEVELVGEALSADGKLLTYRGLPYPSGLFAGTDIGSKGDGGTLTVETERLHLRDGAVVQTSTLGEGDAGDLKVQASESVEVIGKAADGRLPTSLYALSGGTPGLPGFEEATGRGGDLEIKTGELIVQDGAAVAVGSFSRDALGAGNLQVQAQTIRLQNLGQLTAETNSGQGGNITLLVQELLLLRRNSSISTTAGIAGTGGNGGNITIDNNPFIVAVPSENSDIKANAFQGQGGKVTINAESIFGLAQRNLEDLQTLLETNDPRQLDPARLPSSDITAISQTNPSLSGEVTINTPDVDPSQGLVTLPQEVVDVSGLIAQGCPASVAQGQSKFIVTGRGGLPPSPSDPLSSNTVWRDLRPIAKLAETQPTSESATQATNPTPRQIVEATGWVINNKGEVVLTAFAPTVTPDIPWLTPASCSGS